MTRIIPLALLVAALLLSSIGWSQDDERKRAAADYPYSADLVPGDAYLLHGSDDTVIEVYVDVPVPKSNARVKVQLGSNKDKFLLPNAAAVRLQGQVVLSRESTSTARTTPTIKVYWRHVDNIFRTYSRSESSSSNAKKE